MSLNKVANNNKTTPSILDFNHEEFRNLTLSKTCMELNLVDMLKLTLITAKLEHNVVVETDVENTLRKIFRERIPKKYNGNRRFNKSKPNIETNKDIEKSE